ncbi:MAG: hypothetical protein RL237_507, partial [Actinomycetota bacterium]
LPATTKVSTTLSADDLRICNEILQGDTSNTRKLKAISKEAARELAENTKTGLDYKRGVNGDIYLDGLLSLELDIAKALALGASSVMLGSLLAGTHESPGQIVEKSTGLYKRYRGAASLETKTVHGQAQRNVEGESTIIPYKGGVKFIVEGLIDGVKSALSYAGADSLAKYHPKWVQITNAGQTEAKPHLL